jgi:hypothetical protein
MTIDAMAITDPKHPETLYSSQVLNRYETILIGLYLRWNETLSSFDSETIDYIMSVFGS